MRFEGRRGAGSVTIIGPGRLGQALGKMLTQAGVPMELVVARRISRARRAVRFIGAGQAAALGDFRINRAKVILLTTTDAAIRPVAEALAARGMDWRGKVVLHTCGSLPASILQSLARRGAAIGSIHPFQPIPDPATGVQTLPGCYWAVEGAAPARAAGEEIVRLLRGIAFPIRPSRKALYHVSGIMVCPALLGLLSHSERLLTLAGVPSDIARAMLARSVRETVGNFTRLGGRRALTGPAARGDWATLRRHFAALRRDAPGVVPAYAALVSTMLRLTGKRPPSAFKKVLRNAGN
ncbi:MAG: Rossmann-like and DUF2520 domain-containing protein [Terriglobia bacterium]